MVFLDKFFGLFCRHAAIVNEDALALQKDIKAVQRCCGPWIRVKGFTSYGQLFYALHLAKAKRRPFEFAFLHRREPEAGSLVLGKTDPLLKTYRYSDTKQLEALLPALR